LRQKRKDQELPEATALLLFLESSNTKTSLFAWASVMNDKFGVAKAFSKALSELR
jgi:hypothetical protein